MERATPRPRLPNRAWGTLRVFVGREYGLTAAFYPPGRSSVQKFYRQPRKERRGPSTAQPNHLTGSEMGRKNWVAQWRDLSSLSVVACRTSARLSAREDRTPRLSHTLDRQKHEGCPRLGSAAWVLGSPVPFAILRRPPPAKWQGRIRDATTNSHIRVRNKIET